jgi:ParB-like chromosome segregation protein Spo0J
MSKKRIVWHLEVRPLIDLIPYEKNPRIITKEGLAQLKKSFDEIGFAQPININTDGTVLSGHARLQQLKSENALEVECYVPDRLLTPKQEEAVIIRMNKNIAGEFDFEMLANEFELDDLLEWGFNADQLVDISAIDSVSEDSTSLDEKPSKYLLQVELPNQMELDDIYDDLISKGYLARKL